MEKTLKLVGKTSNEIFTLRYPTSLLDFTEYDFSYFAKHSIDLCNESLKSGVENIDRIADLRHDIQSAHCFIEHNIRTIYDKIVLDCWIDYVCRRDSIGVNVLWNRFIRCKTDFEKAVFSRLCDFRYNRAINEWLNIVRVQDYARCKVEFIFVDGIKTVDEAIARRNYFDLAFSVTARELGCRIEDLGVTKTFSAGRVPTAPFLFPTVSKEIVRNLLGDFDYSEDYSGIGDYSEISDKIAMDAFARMKAGLPQDLSKYGIMHGSMDSYREKIYMPCSLKAAVDLEIDAIIESGTWLGKCKRCGRYFLRDKEHLQEYCSRIMPSTGKTCLEVWEAEHPKKPAIDEYMEKKCREVNEMMFARVDKTISGTEYNYWHSYLEAMKQKVLNGEISADELENFLDYSLVVDITKSTPIVEVPKKEPELPQYPKERVVKPFVPERISRDSIPQPVEPDPEEERVLKEGFFTSPSKKRQKNEKPQISHIIRNGESLGEDNYTKKPDPAGFQPFAPISAEPQAPEATENRRNPYDDLKRLEDRLEEEKRIKREKAAQIARQRELDEEEEARRNMVKTFAEPEFTEEFPVRSAHAKNEEPYEPPVFPAFDPDEEPPFPIYDDIPEEMKPAPRPRRSERRAAEPTAAQELTKPVKQAEPEEPKEPAAPPKPKVIRKNAAAISAYGRASGAPMVTAAEAELAAPREERRPESRRTENRRAIEEDLIEAEPFKDIGSIFDVLQQSEGGTGERRPRSRHTEAREAPEPTELPQRVTRENAPAGIWTEDRGLYNIDERETEQSELDMLKSKKHGKSNKTRRLYDVIMREPDDNPNFRKK